MADIAVSGNVILRDGFGRFIRACEDAAEYTVRDAVEEGARMSREMAPTGGKVDPRTIPLRESIESEVISRTQGRWFATARHALPIEFGAGPHGIPGEVSFFWENEGKWWTPGSNTINHPGNAAQPYLRPAYRAVMAKLLEIARRYYP